jgi:hypothetical protein
MIKIFGHKLFEQQKESRLYDFAQHGILKGTSTTMDYGDYVQIADLDYSGSEVSGITKKKKQPSKKKLPELTPKEIYELGTLTIPKMAINCRPDYLDEQLIVLKQKIELLIPKKPRAQKVKLPKALGGHIADAWEVRDSSDMTGVYKYAYQEMCSMLIRLENRRQYESFKDGYNDWPYTTSEAIAAVLNAHTHLKAENIATLIPDLPKEAVKEIARYEKLTDKLCDQKTNYYLIVEKAKTTDVTRRRDPILLAQSPFGFFWQILGAWDKEVKFLEEL